MKMAKKIVVYALRAWQVFRTMEGRNPPRGTVDNIPDDLMNSKSEVSKDRTEITIFDFRYMSNITL